MKDAENLTERITIRVTESELADLNRFAKAEGDRKVSTFARRILSLYIRKKSVRATDAGDLAHVSMSDQLAEYYEDPTLVAAEDRGKYGTAPRDAGTKRSL